MKHIPMFILAILALNLFSANEAHTRDLTPMHTLCDQVWFNTYVGQVELKDYPFCKNRWTLHTNHEKRYLRNFN